MYSLEVNTDGLEAGFDKFVKEKERQLMKNVKSIADLIRDDIKDNIMYSRKVPSGTLKKNTASTIKKKGFDKPMYDTGQLRKSIRTQPIQDGYEVFIDGQDNIDKAFYNHYDRHARRVFGKWVGLDIKKNKEGSFKIPARPFFGIRSKIKSDLKKILHG